MKRSSLVQASFIGALISVPFSPSLQLTEKDKIEIYKSQKAVSCTPDLSSLTAMLENTDIPLMPGSGTYVWKINTSSDSAKYYFNQGINTYYGFHIIESLASFKKAARFDPENPMVWWAQALAYGPNINDVEYKTSPDALAASRMAVKWIDRASSADQDLIRAMAVRYSDDTSQKRDLLNQAYVDAMKKAYEKNPRSADVLALYADAMMLQHPWDLWNVEGTPKPWTPHIQEVLEKALAINQLHPGANHYYIHVIEPSPNPEKARANADRLGEITPGLAHLVHMPSHIYLRTGEFNKGVSVNQQAVSRFREYSSIFPAVGEGAFLYYLHNQHMLVNCAMHAGRYGVASDAAEELSQAIDSATLYTPPPMGSLIQYIYMSPVLIDVRFEKWDSLLNMAKPDDRLVYANILYHFGKGMANSTSGGLEEARRHSMSLKQLMKDDNLRLPMTPFSSAIEGAVVASEMLDGMISLKEKKYEDAIRHFGLASETEIKMVYNEPRDWFLNPHQYLGTAYLLNKNYGKAEEVFKKDLKINANNVWSLYGLREVYQRQGDKKKATFVKKLLENSASEADTDAGKMSF